MSEIASTQDEREAQEAKLRVEELRSQVNYHDYRYHVLDSPEVSDYAASATSLSISVDRSSAAA